MLHICYCCDSQVKGYTRGKLIRAVGPRIRRRLLHRMNKMAIDTAGLRSFLDPPKRRGKNSVGSGKVAYVVHQRNHKKKALTLGLRKATKSYVKEFLGSGTGHRVKFSLVTQHIHTRICFSGRYERHSQHKRAHTMQQTQLDIRRVDCAQVHQDKGACGVRR